MLKVNGVDIETGYSLEVVEDNDTERAFSNFKYAKPYFEGTEVNVPYFKKNGVPIDFCAKGCRPAFNLRSLFQLDVHVSDDPYNRSIAFVKNGDKFRYMGADQVEYRRFILFELIGGGGGGSGGNAIVSGVGGGAGAYALVLVDYDKLIETFPSATYLGLNIYAGYGGAGSASRGDAGWGVDSRLSVNVNNEFVFTLTAKGGQGASAGEEGQGGTVETEGTQPAGITILYSANGQSGTVGTGTQTSTCPQIVHKVGFDTEGEKYRLTRGGYSMTTAGSGAGCGGSSQFGAGGQDGRTNNGYDGKDAGSSAYGAGGGGGRAKAFDSTTGGDGGDGMVFFYY